MTDDAKKIAREAIKSYLEAKHNEDEAAQDAGIAAQRYQSLLALRKDAERVLRDAVMFDDKAVYVTASSDKCLLVNNHQVIPISMTPV